MDVSTLSPDVINQGIVFGPDMLQLIEAEIQLRKITYQQLATKIHTATGTVGSWFCRKAIPADKVWSVVAAIGSPKLWSEAISRIPGNVFREQYLDGADDHPLIMMDELIDNAEEMLRRAKESRTVMRHKKRGFRFEGEDAELVILMEDSVVDLLATSKMVLIRNEDYFGRSVDAAMDRHCRRMKEVGLRTIEIKEKTACKAAAR